MKPSGRTKPLPANTDYRRTSPRDEQKGRRPAGPVSFDEEQRRPLPLQKRATGEPPARRPYTLPENYLDQRYAYPEPRAARPEAAEKEPRPVSRRAAPPPPKPQPVFKLDALTSQAPVVKDAVLGLLETLKPKPAPVPASGDEPFCLAYERSLAHERQRGRRTLSIATAFFVFWAGFIPLSGAVIVAGNLVVKSSVKRVQHPTGGVVTKISVQNGQRVIEGEELARLDETQARTNLQVVAKQYDEVRLRIARLEAERDGVAEPKWPNDLAAELSPAERQSLLSSERDFFAARASTRRGQQELADSRIKQLEKQIAGLEAQLSSNSKQAGITTGELKNVETLLQQKLVTLQRATSLQREAARLDGLDGQLISQIAETRNRVNEARLQAMQSEQTFLAEVMRDLREAQAKQGELAERKLAAEDQLRRIVIRAPVTGVVQELAIHTIGGVIGPGEALMAVVPEGDALEIDAKLPPDKIDQARIGQKAHVRLSAFNARTTPELTGVVNLVSADLVADAQTHAAYYDLRVTLPPEEVRKLGALQLVPGMPAEVFLETGSRTMLSYLLKPLTDQFSRMFRER